MRGSGDYGPKAYVPPGWSSSVLWWKFDTASTNPVIDYSALGTSTGYIFGATAVNSSWNTNGYYNLTNGPYIRTYGTDVGGTASNYTYALWIRPGAASTQMGIFHSRVLGTDVYGLRFGTAATNISALAGNNSTAFTPTNSCNVGFWHRLVVVKGGTSASNTTVYIDGSNAAMSTVALPAFSIKTFWALSGANGAAAGQGSYDDALIITGYTWSASEVLNDYNAGRSIAPVP
jgi:hypothetical protein